MTPNRRQLFVFGQVKVVRAIIKEDLPTADCRGREVFVRAAQWICANSNDRI
jgi:hypothetical protein